MSDIPKYSFIILYLDN